MPDDLAPESRARFLDALRSGDRATVERELAAEPGLARTSTPEGVSALLHALYARQPELARVLVRARGREDLDLHEAAALDEVDALRARLGESPEGVERPGADGFTPLHLACYFGAESAARLLIEASAPVDAVAANGSLLCPLHAAAAAGSVTLCTRLLEAGADPDARQAGGFTALHAAAHRANVALARALLAGGADPRARTDGGQEAADLVPDAAEAAGELRALIARTKTG